MDVDLHLKSVEYTLAALIYVLKEIIAQLGLVPINVASTYLQFCQN